MALFEITKRVSDNLKKFLKLRLYSTIKRFLNTFGFPLFLVALSSFLAYKNYTPNTILSGWDTLHPEFNLPLNLTRTIFGVFRTEQGLGALASHAHMVELPKILLYFLFEKIFPLELLRYLYIFLCLVIGPLGMYFFLYKVVIKKSLPSFLGALFYLLNLGTYQTFLVPFEMFTTAYAAIPFLFLSTSLMLAHLNRKHFAFFLIVLIFATGAAYAPTLGYVMMTSLVLYFTPLVILKRKTFPGISRRFFLVLLTIFAVNTYWLLPNIYFALNGAVNVADANINKIFSEEAFLKNKQFGTLSSILSLKIFYFDWNIFDHSTNSFIQLTQAFLNHLKQPFITFIGYLFASFLIGGLLYSINRFRQYSLGLILILLLCLLFLFNDNPPTAFLFNNIRDHVPFFKEAFRFPDNKIFNVFIFLMAIYFALFQEFVLKMIQKLKSFNRFLTPLYVLIFTFALILYMLPAFYGNLIHPTMRITIPPAYFELFDALKLEKNGRIANLPINSPWGWVYHNWYASAKPSFQGAGFLYFGVPQSLLERDFDRWDKANEQYYREMSHAVYSKDSIQLKTTIQKFGVTHVLVDTSIIVPGNNTSTLFYKEINNLMNILIDEKFAEKGKRYGDFLTLYRIKVVTPFPLTTRDLLVSVGTSDGAYFEDNVYKKYSNYAPLQNKVTFPFEGIFNNEYKSLMTSLSIKNETLSVIVPRNNYQLSQIQFSENNIPTTVVASKDDFANSLKISLYPQTVLFDKVPLLRPISGTLGLTDTNTIFSVNEKVFKVSQLTANNPTVVGSAFLQSSNNMITIYDTILPPSQYAPSQLPITFSYCDALQNGSLSSLLSGTSLTITTNDSGDICLFIPLYFIDLSETNAALVQFQFSTNAKGLFACLSEISNKSCLSSIEVESVSRIKSIDFAVTPQVAASKKLMIRIPKGNKKVVLNDLRFSRLPELSSFAIEAKSLQPVDPGTFQEVTLPVPQDESFIFNANDNTILINDCKNRSTNSKKNVKYQGGRQAFVYTSEIGSYCDHVSFPNLPHSFSYLVFVESKNVKGLPLRLCITNYTSRNCDIYAKLSNLSDNNNDVFFLPSSDATGRGYDANIENVGIIRTPSENELYGIRFVPIPYSLLSKITNGEIRNQTFPGMITNVKLLNPTAFLFSTNGKRTYIDLSYGYQKGFELYSFVCSNNFSCSLKSFLPFIFGKPIGTHTITNRWANGWEIDPKYLSSDPKLQTINSKLQTSIVLVYLPQYLEYLGFALLGIPLLFILYWPFKAFLTPHILKLNSYFEIRTSLLKQKIHLRFTNQ